MKPLRSRSSTQRKPWVSSSILMTLPNAASAACASVKLTSWRSDWMWISISRWVAGANPLPSGVNGFNSFAPWPLERSCQTS
ncbi:hypothetical protein AK51_00945 [Serratia nematodiphila DZ0503SBS1]|nr:hypothetical protein AK51_00945 [Serratia nematodiphila DZ0503SBS1]